MIETDSHKVSTQRTGSSDYGYVRAVCTCGWKSIQYSRRTIEGYSLAERDGDRHKKAPTT